MEHACDLAERVGSLLLDESSSDITLVVEGESLWAHKLILSTSCEHFRDLRGSPLNEMTLDDIPLRGFKHVLTYIYTGQVNLKDLDTEAILELLDTAHQFGIDQLQAAVCRHLQKDLSTQNLGVISSKAQVLNLDDLSEACCRFMEEFPDAVLRSESFQHLPAAIVYDTLSRDTFCAEEIEIFRALEQWCSINALDENAQHVLGTIRLPLIAAIDLVTTVKDSGLVSTEHILEAIQTRESNLGYLNFRGIMVRGENVASPDREALRLTANASGNFVTPRTCPVYDSEKMPPYESNLKFNAESGLTVALSKPHFINHIAFRLLEEPPVRYSYYVEVSMNLVDWIRVVDHSSCICRSFQRLYFEPRVLRYLRIMGTKNAECVDIELSMFEASYVEKQFKFSLGYLFPEQNVATEQMGANVIECEGGWNEMLGGSSPDDFAGTGWTYHRIGSGAITIQLSQPYTVNSMRMLLGGDDTREYSYYVETSVDERVWTCVADRTADFYNAMQDISFEAQPVIFIKIVGTACTTDEFLLCSSFECPAQEPDQVEDEEEEEEEEEEDEGAVSDLDVPLAAGGF